MNRKIIVMLSVIFFIAVASVWSDKKMFASDMTHRAKGKHKDEIELQQKIASENSEEQEEEEIESNVDTFDLQQKQKEVRSLLDRGVAFCANNNMREVCRAFTHTKEFIEGELYLFLMGVNGVMYAHGDREDLVWQNLWEYRDRFGANAIQSIIKTAKQGAGWLTYEWAGSTKVSYVQMVKIDNVDYVVGCGYYPHSKKYAAIGLVKGAVALFNNDLAQGRSTEASFSTMGYPLSDRFVFGDLYLYALDFNGVIRAQGDDPNLIGSHALNRKDSKGKAINQEIISKLKAKEEGEGVWIEYVSKNALKVAYAEKVKDEKGNYYFIACGYYPETDRSKTVDLVRRGYQLMKGSGTSIAAKQFTDRDDNSYRLGDLYLFVYDMQGKCIADGNNATSVGQNHFNEKDQDGRYYIREIIEQAKTGNGWLDFKLKNSFQATYVEKVDMGVDTYIIGSVMFPVSKPETMTLLVKSAIGYFENHTPDEMFRAIVDRNGAFIRGDLFLFALDTEGYCYAWGDSYELIWKNLMNWKDDEGKMFIKEMINKSSQGSEPFVYRFNKRTRADYIEVIEKNGKQYLIGSGFYK